MTDVTISKNAERIETAKTAIDNEKFDTLRVVYFNDYHDSGLNRDHTMIINRNGGLGLLTQGTAPIAGSNWMGVIRLDTPDSANSATAIWANSSSGGSGFALDFIDTRMVMECRVKLSATLVSPEKFRFITTSGEEGPAPSGDDVNANGVGIEYDPASSSNWRLRSKDSGGIEETTTTSTAVAATTYTKLKIDLNYGTDVKFYINDVLEATHTTRVPANAGNDSSGVALLIIDNASGTANESLYIDWLKVSVEPVAGGTSL